MSFSANESHVRTAVLAAAGTGAYVFPLIVPWHPLIFVISAGVGTFQLPRGTPRWIWCAACIVTLVAVFVGVLPSRLAAAIASASALSVSAAPAVAVAILALHTSMASTLQEIVAGTIHSGHVET